MGKAVDKRLYNALKPVRRRVWLRHFIRYGMLGAILALSQAIVWLGASFAMPIPYMWYKVVACGFGIILMAVVVSAFYCPLLKDCAREADRLGLGERAITAYERMGLEDAFSVLQREDAIRSLERLDARMISVMPPKKWALAVVCLILLLVAGSLLPNPQSQIVDRQIRVQREIANQVERLEQKVRENLAGQAELTAEEKQELMDLVKQLVRRIKQTNDYREAIKEVSKSEQQLAQLVDRFRERRMELLGEAMEKYGPTEGLGRATEAMDARAIRHAIENLKEQIEQGKMDAEAMQLMGDAFANAAAALPNGSLKEQLEKAAEAAAIEGQLDHLTRELDSLGNMLAHMAENGFANPADIRYLLQGMKYSIASAAGQGIGLVQNSDDGHQGLEGYLSDEDDGKLDDGGNGMGDGQSSDKRMSSGRELSSENENGGSSGSGEQVSGSRQGSGASGGTSNAIAEGSSGSTSAGLAQGSSSSAGSTMAGSGHSNGDAGYQGNGVSSREVTKGQGNPSSYGEYERIYDPTRLSGGGHTIQVTGKPSGQGTSQQVELGSGLGSFDGFVPYNEVFGSYRRQAMQALERMDIPAEMRELIEKYFDAIE